MREGGWVQRLKQEQELSKAFLETGIHSKKQTQPDQEWDPGYNRKQLRVGIKNQNYVQPKSPDFNPDIVPWCSPSRVRIKCGSNSFRTAHREASRGEIRLCLDPGDVDGGMSKEGLGRSVSKWWQNPGFLSEWIEMTGLTASGAPKGSWHPRSSTDPVVPASPPADCSAASIQRLEFKTVLEYRSCPFSMRTCRTDGADC